MVAISFSMILKTLLHFAIRQVNYVVMCICINAVGDDGVGFGLLVGLCKRYRADAEKQEEDGFFLHGNGVLCRQRYKKNHDSQGKTCKLWLGFYVIEALFSGRWSSVRAKTII